MPQHRVEYGDPDRDEIHASAEEIFDLQEHPGWHEVRRHLEEILDHRRSRLAKIDIPQREADNLRGQIELCEAILGESEQHQPLLEMLMELAKEQQEDVRNKRRRG